MDGWMGIRRCLGGWVTVGKGGLGKGTGSQDLEFSSFFPGLDSGIGMGGFGYLCVFGIQRMGMMCIALRVVFI